MNRMYSVPEQGQPLHFHDLCGMAEFTFHLRMAYETVTRDCEKRLHGQVSTFRDRTSLRGQNCTAAPHGKVRAKV